MWEKPARIAAFLLILGVSLLSIPPTAAQDAALDSADTRPPAIISGPQVVFIGESVAAIEWQTDELANGVVKYGPDNSIGQTKGVPGYWIRHLIVLRELQPATQYTAQALSSDWAGNGPTTSTLFSFRTLGSPNDQAPVIVRGPMVTGITHNSLIVDWETNKPANSVISFGTTETLGSNITFTELVTEHRVVVTNLLPGTRYFLRASSTDGDGNGPTMSRIFAAKTLSKPDTDLPVITCGPMALMIYDTGATIIWETNELADSNVYYGDGTASSTLQDNRLGFEHAVHLTGLRPSTLYSYTISSKDSSGNGPTQSDALHFETRPTEDSKSPVISEGPIVVYTGRHYALVRWLTDEFSDSAVQFGKTEDLGSTVSRPTLVRRHYISLTNLDAGTKYYLRALSSDGHGNGPASSTLVSFNTRTLEEYRKPYFADGPRVIYRSDQKAILFWRTDQPTDAVVTYGEASDRSMQVCRPELETDHWVTITNLKPGSSYGFTITCSDPDGNIATSADSLLGTQIMQSVANQTPQGGGLDTSPAVAVSGIIPSAMSDSPVVLAVSDTTALILWTTNEAADTRVEYKQDGKSLLEFVGDIALCNEHLMLLTGLTPSSSYSFQAGSQGASGNGLVYSGSGTFMTSAVPDKILPVITRPPRVVMSEEGMAVVTWDTNEYATSQVFYFEEDMPADRMLAARTGLRNEHSVTLTNLSPGGRYRIKCASMDSAGNLVISGESTIVALTPTSASNWALFE